VIVGLWGYKMMYWNGLTGHLKTTFGFLGCCCCFLGFDFVFVKFWAISIFHQDEYRIGLDTKIVV
jgi:hypothetical protein